MPRDPQRFLIKISTLLLSLIITLFILEIVIRIVHFEPPQYVTPEKMSETKGLYTRNASAHWYGQLGSILEFENIVQTNSLGLHDTNHSLQKKPSVFRILCLGDSFVEAYQVPLKDTFFKILENELNGVKQGPLANKKIETIAFGQSGSGSLAELRGLTGWGFQFSPDLVILFVFTQNDFKDDLFYLYDLKKPKKSQITNNPPHDEDIQREFSLYHHLLVFKNSLLNQWLAFKIVQLYREPRLRHVYINEFKDELAIFAKPGTQFFKDHQKIWRNAFTLTAANYIRMKRVCDAKNAQFLVVFVDNQCLYNKERINELYSLMPQLKDQIDFQKPMNDLEKIFAKYKISSLDLTPWFEKYYKEYKRSGHFKYDGHWNKEGHRLTAHVLQDYLMKNLD